MYLVYFLNCIFFHLRWIGKVKHVTRVSDLVNVVGELNGFVGRRRSLVVGILGVLIKTHRQNRYTHRADCTLQHVL